MCGVSYSMKISLLLLISFIAISWSLPEQARLQHANSTSPPVPSALPDFPGYLTFSSYNLLDPSHVAYMYPLAPMRGIGPGPYTSTRGLFDVKLLTAICDTYPDGCQFHNGGGGDSAVGYFLQDDSVNTYIKNSTGTFASSAAGSKYFVLRAPSNVFCVKYVGWDLPADQVIRECNSDSKCDGAVITTNNSHGDLCQFLGNDGQQTHIRLEAFYNGS